MQAGENLSPNELDVSQRPERSKIFIPNNMLINLIGADRTQLKFSHACIVYI